MIEHALPESPTAADWSRVLSRFRTPANGRAIAELVLTIVPFIGLWVLTYIAWMHRMAAVAIPLSLLASAFLVRLFLIQHDCGHGAFFKNRRANDWLGRILGILTLTPYAHWRTAHATHHATHGNLDRRGVGDVDTLTVAEYLARPRWTRMRYRLYRHPVVMFGIGPAYVFFVTNRLPAGFMRSGWRPWLSTMGTNAAAGIVLAALGSSIGLGTLLLVHAPIMLVAATMGVWLFYVQHQFEHSHWTRASTWNARDAALIGSSHYALPPVLRWFTANIGAHHVHHLSSGIPFYRLPNVLRTYPALAAINRLTLRQSFRCAALTLWDEPSHRLVRFADVSPGAG